MGKKNTDIGKAFRSTMTTLDSFHDAPFDALGMGENNFLRRASNLAHDVPYKNLGIKTAEEQRRDVKEAAAAEESAAKATRAASERQRREMEGRRRGMLNLINTSSRGVLNPLAPNGVKLGGF